MFYLPLFFISERFLAKATTTIVTHVSTIQCLHLVAQVIQRLSTPPPTPYIEVRCVCATVKVQNKKRNILDQYCLQGKRKMLRNLKGSASVTP